MSIPNSQTIPSPIHKSESLFLFCKLMGIISFSIPHMKDVTRQLSFLLCLTYFRHYDNL